MRLYKKEQIYNFLKNAALSAAIAFFISLIAHVLIDKDRIGSLEIILSTV